MLLSELKEAEYNPRTISEAALEGLKFSLDEFGDISGIVFNRQTGNLVAGHQRVKALKAKYGDLVIVPLNEEEGFIEAPGKKIFRVRFVDWEIEKEKAANIAANSETIQGDWTIEASLMLEEIALTSPNIYESLNLKHLDLIQIEMPNETIEVERHSSEITKEMRNLLKFGDVTLFLSDEEFDSLNSFYESYIEKNKNTYGLITYLLEGKV